MKRLKTFTILLLTIVLIGFLQNIGFGQGLSKFEIEVPSQENLRNSLNLAQKLRQSSNLSATEIAQIYFADKKIGRCIWGISPKITDSTLTSQLKMFARISDQDLATECIAYIQSYRTHFQLVEDGWKGEENFWEPNQYWIEQAKEYYPNSMESMEIEFDLDFKKFIRRFDINEEAKGMTCRQYYDEELERNRDVYLEIYSEEDIKQWPGECNDIRKEFLRGRSHLLEKYKYAPFTKVLQDIDPTTIVKNHSVC